MLEREFQGWVIDVAVRRGWRVWHVPMPMRPIGGNKFVPESRGRGLLDLTMIHTVKPLMIFAEIKDRDGELSDAQLEFLTLARKVAAVTSALRVFVWRPGNEDVIERILAV